MTKKALKKRIKDLELQRRFISDVLVGLVEMIEPDHGHYAQFMQLICMAAAGDDSLDAFWLWADRQDPSTLTRELLVAEFEARVPPPLRGFFETILKAHRKDGDKAFYCDLVLGKEAVIPS